MHSSKVITFVVSSPSQGDISFQKSDLNWPFFTHSNTLVSHIILRGQENLKTQKFVQEMRVIVITIYFCTHTYMYMNWLTRIRSTYYLISISVRGVMVSTFVFWLTGCECEPWSGLFTFLSKWLLLSYAIIHVNLIKWIHFSIVSPVGLVGPVDPVRSDSPITVKLGVLTCLV